MGVAEALGADIVGDQYKDVVAFNLLVLVLFEYKKYTMQKEKNCCMDYFYRHYRGIVLWYK